MEGIDAHSVVAPGRIRMRQQISSGIGANVEYGWARKQLPPATLTYNFTKSDQSGERSEHKPCMWGEHLMIHFHNTN